VRRQSLVSLLTPLPSTVPALFASWWPWHSRGAEWTKGTKEGVHAVEEEKAVRGGLL